jgi:hypothetical protein
MLTSEVQDSISRRRNHLQEPDVLIPTNTPPLATDTEQPPRIVDPNKSTKYMKGLKAQERVDMILSEMQEKHQ